MKSERKQPAIGFIIFDRKSALFGVLQDNVQYVIQIYQVNLQKIDFHKGGKTSVRFARLRVEKLQNYLKNINKIAQNCFLLNQNVQLIGLVLGGQVQFLNRFENGGFLRYELSRKLLKTVELQTGQLLGFKMAVQDSAPQTRRLLEEYQQTR